MVPAVNIQAATDPQAPLARLTIILGKRLLLVVFVTLVQSVAYEKIVL